MILDLICLTLTVYAFYLGYSKGIVRTLFDMLSLIIGLVAALKLSPIMMNLIEGIFNTSGKTTFILGFILTFIIVLILIRMIGRGMEKVLRTVKINFVNKILGGAIFTGLFLVCYAYILFFLSESRLLSENAKQSSVTYEYLEVLPEKSRALIGKIKPAFKEFWNKTIETMDNVREGSSQE